MTSMNELDPITQVPPLLELSALAAKVPLAEKLMIPSSQKSKIVGCHVLCLLAAAGVVISKLSWWPAWSGSRTGMESRRLDAVGPVK
jgi:hypothetical protein